MGDYDQGLKQIGSGQCCYGYREPIYTFYREHAYPSILIGHLTYLLDTVTHIQELEWICAFSMAGPTRRPPRPYMVKPLKVFSRTVGPISTKLGM